MYEVTMAAVIIYMYIIIVVNMTYTCTMYVLFRVVVGLHLVKERRGEGGQRCYHVP